MKKLILYLVLAHLHVILLAQTGPGGVGNSTSNVLWLKSDVISGLAIDDPISNWTDLSGNGNSLLQADSNFQPFYQTVTHNALSFPVVRFSISNSRLVTNPFSNFPTDAITAIYVNKTTDSGDATVSYATGNLGASNEFLLYNSDALEVFRGPSKITSAANFNDGVFHISNVRWRASDGQVLVYKDGADADALNPLPALNAASISSFGSLALGAEQDEIDDIYTASQSHQGDFAEVMLFNTYLNTAEAVIVTNYLAAKYNIAVSTDYYAYESTHRFDVVGIGREDADNQHEAAMSANILQFDGATGLDQDQEYLFFGHDNEDITNWTSTEVPSGEDILRIAREWRLNETGDVGNVEVSIDIAELPSLTLGYSSYTILVDEDGDFSNGATLYQPTNNGDNTLSFSGVDISNGNYITIAIAVEVLTNTGPGGVGDISNIALWLRAEDLTGLADGDKVQTWADISGNGNTLTQDDLNLSPTFKENIINGFPVVRFDGTPEFGQSLVKTGFSNVAKTEISMVTVSVIYDENPGTHFSYFNNVDNKGFSWYSQHPRATFGDVDELLWGRPTIIESGRVLLFSLSTASAIVQYIKYSYYTPPTFSSTLAGDGITSGGVFALGAALSLDENDLYQQNDFYTGDFSEVIIFNSRLNSVEMALVSEYLNRKYNIESSIGMSFWSNLPLGFNFDQAGIGQTTADDVHSNAQGTGIVRVNNPTDLDDYDFFFWSHNGVSLQSVSTNVPAGISRRLERIWAASERGDNSEGPVPKYIGPIDISFDLTGLGNVNVDQLVLLVDDDRFSGTYDQDFTNAEIIENPVDLGNNIYQFQGVTAFEDQKYFTLGTKNNEDTPLPIDLVEFNGKVTEHDQVELNWFTASEVDNSHFRVERSRNGIDFKVIATIQSKGESQSLTDYVFTDKHPAVGRNYYRLSQHDFSGVYEYSEMISLLIEKSDTQNSYMLSPNPVALGESLKLMTEAAEAQVVEVQVISPVGIVLYQQSFSIRGGTDEVYLNTASLAKGVNFLKIKDSNSKVRFFKLLIK